MIGKSAHFSKGYSLVELIFVLVITAIIFSIGIASFRHPLARYELLLAARQIESDLDESRQQAMTNQQTWWVRFAPFNPRYSVWNGQQEVKSVTLPQGIGYLYGYLGLNRYNVDFDYIGATNSGGRIQLVNSFGDQATITLFPITGEVTMTDQ